MFCLNMRHNSFLLAPLALLLPVCGQLLAQGSQGLDSHVHGTAELNVVVMGQQIQFEFISPAMNLLGFERAPQTQDEITLFEELTVELQTGSWLLAEALADCQQTSLDFAAPDFGEETHEDTHDHDHEHESATGTHADFRVQYLYDCTSAPGKAFRLNVFNRFRGIEELTVQWLADGRQGLGRLTPNNPSLAMD